MEFQLRPWTSTDLPALITYANNWNIAKNLTNAFPHPYTKENGEYFITMATQAEPITIFAIDVQGEAIGAAGLHVQADIYEKNMELGYWLAEPFWGQGLMTRVVRQMVDYAFHTFPIARVYARPFGNNLASQKVLEKAGFNLDAKLVQTLFKNGEFIDEYIYSIRRPA